MSTKVSAHTLLISSVRARVSELFIQKYFNVPMPPVTSTVIWAFESLKHLGSINVRLSMLIFERDIMVSKAEETTQLRLSVISK